MRRLGWMLVLTLTVSLAAGADPAERSHLRVGMRVKADGELQPDGTLLADTVSLRRGGDTDLELSGAIQEVDTASGALRVNGVWAIPDERALDRRSRRIARRLEAGDWVKLEGKLGSDSILVLDQLERLGDDDRETEVEGMLLEIQGGADRPTVLRVGPLAVDVGEATQLKGFE